MQTSLQSKRFRSYQWHTHLNALLLSLVIAESVFAQEPRDAKAELENVRALPYGFYVQCEEGDLKIRKKGSATFVVRNSHTCVQIRLQIAERYRNDFTLCSNDPTYESRPPDRVVVKCVDLTIDAFEI